MLEKTKTDVAREYKIIKANELIQKSRFSLSTQEQKIILYVISRIKPTDTELVEQTFSILDFCKICGLDSDNGANYKYIKNTLKGLRDKSIWVTLDDGSESTLAWISKVTMSKQSGIVKIKLQDDMKPYLLQLQEKFTQYELIYTLAMKSQYSIRLYELLKSYQWKKKHTFNIDDLKKILDAENYINFKDFRVKVLEIALREISTYSDIEVSYEIIKEGKKYSKLVFDVKLKRDLVEIVTTKKNILEKIDPERPTLFDMLIEGEEEK